MSENIDGSEYMDTLSRDNLSPSDYYDGGPLELSAEPTVSPEDTAQVKALLQEANLMANADAPTITVIAQLNGSKVVKAEWADAPVTLSDRTIAAVAKLGINVVDNKENYVF